MNKEKNRTNFRSTPKKRSTNYISPHNLKTFKSGQFIEKQLTENEHKILQTVETGFDYTSEIHVITLGDYHQHMSKFVVVDPLLGQRDPSDEIDDASFNLGILKGSSSRKIMQLSSLKHRLAGLKKSYDNADNVDRQKFYARRIDRCEKYIAEGYIWHLDDGQNRNSQYFSVFAPDSKIPIELENDLIFSYDVIEKSTGKPRRVEENLKGNCMADMPETLREYILLQPTSFNITSTEDDLLLSELFNDDNNGTRASKYARIQQLARSILKSQLEQVVLDCPKPSNYEFNYQKVSVVDPKTGKLISSWTPAEFLVDRWSAGIKSNSLYGRGSLGWQNLLLNIIVYSMGNDLNSERAFTQRPHRPLQNNVVFGTNGFDKCSPILMELQAGMTDEDKQLIADFQHGMAIAIDDLCTFKGLEKDTKGNLILAFKKLFRNALGVNCGFLFGKVRNDSGFFICNWGELLKRYIAYDEKVYAETQYPIWQPEDADEPRPKCSLEDVGKPKWKVNRNGKPKLDKKGNKIYESRTTGFWWECQDQTHADNLKKRKERIGKWLMNHSDELLNDGIIGKIPDRNYTQSTINNYWEKQEGKCGYSQKNIDPDLLTTEHVDINYDDYKEGLLHLIGETQKTNLLNNFFNIDEV